MQSQEPIWSRFPTSKNPFLFSPAADDASPDTSEQRYLLVVAGPPVPRDEVELSDTPALEARLRWGDNVLGIVHATPPRSLYAGEDRKRHLALDFFVPVEKLGADRVPLVLVDHGVTRLVIPKQVKGFLRTADGRRTDLQALRQGGAPCAELAGAVEVELPEGASADVTFGDMTFSVASVAAGRPVAAASIIEDRRPLSYFAAVLVGMSAFLGGMAYFEPSLGLLGDEGVTRENLYLMQQYLTALAERNQELDPTDPAPETGAGEAGERAKGAEGQAGKAESKLENQRMAVKGPHDNPDRHLSKHEVLREAESFGMIGLLSTFEGDPNALTSPFGRDTTLGSDDESAMGNIFGNIIGEARGSGLALSGLGEGGGGIGTGVGLTNVGTIGLGLGKGGMGFSSGRLGGSHTPKAKAPRTGVVQTSGRLPPEVIQRIVRQNYGRFRMCYEHGLTQNPTLEGRVTARFVIDRTGAVSNVSNGGSDIPSSDVTSCVIRGFYNLSFPPPDGGIVTVSYPILFSPG